MLPRNMRYHRRSTSSGFSPTRSVASPSKHSMPSSWLHLGASTHALATLAHVSMSEYPVMPASVETRMMPMYAGPSGSSAPSGLLYSPSDLSTNSSTLVIFTD